MKASVAFLGFPYILSLKIITGGTSELFSLLDHNEADMVCTLDSHIYSTDYMISAEEMVGVHFVCSSNNVLVNVENISLEAILSQPFLLTERGMSYRRLLDEKLASLSLEVKPTLEISSADLICRLAEENAGVAFLPDYVTAEAVARGSLVRLSVDDLDFGLWKQLIYRRDKWLSKPMRAILEHLSKVELNK